MPRFLYTDEMIEFLREGYQRMEINDLVAAFNGRFGTDKSRTAIHSALTNRGLTCGRRGMIKGRHLRLFTAEQMVWIREAYTRLSLEDMTAEFNRTFGTGMKVSQLRSFTRNHRIRSGRSGHFNDGHDSWNKGTKGLTGANSGSFKKGIQPMNTRELHAERICTKDGYILIKVEEPNPYTGAKTRFRHKHIVVWEREHGPIPEGHVVSFKDGDRLNCEPDNLELLSRGELGYLNCHGVKDLPPELRTTMRAVARLKIAVGRASV